MVGAAGEAGPHGDVARVAAHHLDDHHTVVRLGGGVQPVDRVAGDLHGGVEAEGELGRADVVVDRLGHADARDPVGLQVTCHAPSVPSPPMATKPSSRWRSTASRTRSTPSSNWYGWMRDVPRMVPPRGRIPRHRSTSSSSQSSSSTPRHASRNPMMEPSYTRWVLRTTARITALRPGQSPPAVRMPMRIVGSYGGGAPPRGAAPPAEGGNLDASSRVRTLSLHVAGCRGFSVVIAIDAGTTGVRAFAVDGTGRPIGRRYREFTQHFPRPGWVEHDATEIWDATCTVLCELVAELGAPRRRHRHHRPARDRRGLGPAHRRPSPSGHRLAGPAHRRALRRTGRGRTPATGPLDDRPGARPVLLGHEDRVAADRGRREGRRRPALGTVDSWLLWNLTGGAVPRHRPVQRQPHDALRHPLR